MVGVKVVGSGFGLKLGVDGLRVGCSGKVTQDKKMLRCHLPRVVYHQVYNVYSD